MQTLLSPSSLSVSELNAIAKQLLENQLDGLWIRGELSNVNLASSGHYYFVLKDENAQIRCALFRQQAMRLAMVLKNGDAVELTGKVGIYEARGDYQITVQDIRAVGLGDLHRRFEQLKQTLQAAGLFDSDKKRRLPEMPRAIGVVSSLAAAALRDVVSTLKRRAPHIPVIVYPTPVQGAGSETQIAQAIELASQRREVDVLIVCRGGGSMEDLWAFNEEVVVRAIADCAVPIVSGVGHETDFTLADFAADLRAPTPTAAAELASPNQQALRQMLQQFHEKLHKIMQQCYQNHGQHLDWLVKQLRHPKDKLIEQKQVLSYFQAALKQQMAYQIQQQHQRLQHQYVLLEAVSPQQILQRGFAIVQDSRGRVVTGANGLKLGQKLRLTFADGVGEVRVETNLTGDLFDE